MLWKNLNFEWLYSSIKLLNTVKPSDSTMNKIYYYIINKNHQYNGNSLVSGLNKYI